jgi:hypothetical protein
MTDALPVALGLGVFVVLTASPVWLPWARGGPTSPPALELPQGQGQCIESRAVMRERHPTLLTEWRDARVRQGQSRWVASGGREFRISLTATCLGCHNRPTAFCDRCHAYAGVEPACWNCHQRPAEGPP